MSKFFEFVSANLRLAGNLMISPSERFHAGHLTSNVSGLAFEGLRGVTESFNAAAHSVSKKAHKSLWATFCDSIDFSESIAAFSLMAAPSERTSVAAQSLWTTYCNSSAYAETRMPQAAKKEATASRSLWANFALMAAPSERASVSAQALWTTNNERSNYAETRLLKSAAQSKSSSWWANFSLMVSPSSVMSPVAMRQFAQSPILAQLREEAALKPAVKHESVFATLAQTSAYAEERTDFNPAEHAVPAAKAETSMSHERLADLLAQCSLSPTQRLVDLQVAPQAPEVQAESLSSYALATLTEQPALSNEELTSLYLKRFAWLDSTQSLLMAHLAQTIAQSDNEVKVQEPETEAYVAARWDGIVNALTEDTPQAIAALPYKAPAAPESGVLAALKRMTASESKKIAAQVSAGHRLPRLS